MKTLFIVLIMFVTNFSYANVPKENFKKVLTEKLPVALCNKMAVCYGAKAAACAAQMKDPVTKCVNTGDGLYGKQITSESASALDFLIRSCALRTYASQNISKLVKKNKKCQQFSTAALTY
jgi:hypothetical protein